MEELSTIAFCLVLVVPFCSMISYSLYIDTKVSRAAKSRYRAILLSCPVIAISAFVFYQSGLPPDTIRMDWFFSIPALVVTCVPVVLFLMRMLDPP